MQPLALLKIFIFHDETSWITPCLIEDIFQKCFDGPLNILEPCSDFRQFPKSFIYKDGLCCYFTVTNLENKLSEMAQICKDHTQLEISCSADKYFEIFTSKPHLFPKICPDKIQNCDLIEGDGATIGSVKLWKFVPESGKAEIAKEKIEAIDMLNKSVTFKVTEGNMLSYYKNMKARVAVTTEGEKTLANLYLEYEKLNEAYPAPTQYLEFFVAYSKDIDNYLSKA